MTTASWSPSFALELSLLAWLPACEMGARTVGYEPIDVIEPGVERELTRPAPCSVVGSRAFLVTDPAGSVALSVGLPTPARNQSWAGTYDVAEYGVHVSLKRGTNLFSDWCNQVPDRGPPDIEEWWVAPDDASQHGIIRIDFEDPEEESLELATVTLVDVTLRREDADGEPDLVIDEYMLPR